MQIVIDIPEDGYKVICKWGAGGAKMVDDAIKDGIVLPKGHGRLIDESKIEVCEWVDVLEEGYPKASTDAPTIIEADTEDEE